MRKITEARVLALALVLVLSMGASTMPAVRLEAQAGPVRSILLANVTSGTGQFDASTYTYVTFYLQSTGTTSGGTVSLEEADYDATTGTYSGTWSVISAIAASSFTGGAQTAYHVQATAFAVVRARISSAITGGGTVSVTVRAK